MPSVTNKLTQVINNNFHGLNVIPNTSVSYVNLLQGSKNTRHNFVCIQKVNNSVPSVAIHIHPLIHF